MSDEILTSNGDYFLFNSPEQYDFPIEVISNALSKICRFTGHTSEFYSVAQHSVLVSEMVPRKYAFQGLMHDAHEAFTGDMVSPLKKLIPEYVILEKKIESELRLRYSLPESLHESIKIADIKLLMSERRCLFPYRSDDNLHWPSVMSTIDIKPMNHNEAYFYFLNRYKALSA